MTSEYDVMADEQKRYNEDHDRGSVRSERMTELREALATFPYDELPDDPSTIDLDAYKVVAAAARRWLALTETGPDYEAAAKALSAGIFQGEFDEVPEVQRKLARLTVDAALADYLTEEETK